MYQRSVAAWLVVIAVGSCSDAGVTDTSAAGSSTPGSTTAQTTTTSTAPVPLRPTDPVRIAPCDVPASCAHPLAGRAIWQIPVVTVAFLPDADRDGVIDLDTTGWRGTVEDLRSRIEVLNNEGAWWATEASRSRGEGMALSDPSLAFGIVDQVFLDSAVPQGLEVPWKPGEGWYRPDYRAILTDLDVCGWIDDLGVREIWMWTQHHGGIEPTESNMAGKFGDISNSEHSDDLPLCRHSYTVYNFNFARTAAEMLHNRGHQAEALFRRADPVLWERFTGPAEGGQYQGCGDTHLPPNAAAPYDYHNPVPALSDCSDWRPTRDGSTGPVTCATWSEHVYGTPECVEDGGLAFYVWWMQGFPGRERPARPDGITLTNWWELFADLDGMESRASWLAASPAG